jgi:hypothetical protein
MYRHPTIFPFPTAAAAAAAGVISANMLRFRLLTTLSKDFSSKI